MNNHTQTAWYIEQLTGDVNTVIDWRLIHDKRNDLPAHTYRGTLAEIYPTLQSYNEQNYGVFCCINATDGRGRELSNIAHIRTHVVDLDNTVTAQANYERAVADGACFAVQSSIGKYHVYWKVEPYTGNDFFTLIQRKLNQLYDADKSIIDATRVMRVPGFNHCKTEPTPVTCWALDNVEKRFTSSEIQNRTNHINVIDHMSMRSPLGSPEMSAPSLEYLKLAMTMLSPNDLDRFEWLSFSAAIKQAGWNHTDEKNLYNIWSEWCGQYGDNDSGENLKLWNSIVDTEVGWKSIERKTPIKAYIAFNKGKPPAIPKPPPINEPSITTAVADAYGEILSETECKEYFKNCYFVERTGQIFNPVGRFMNATQFNGRYGGKQFIISTTGKLSDEPWKAALRSTCWTIPKVDHVRFLPDKPTFDVVIDGLGRKGLNTYIPAKVKTVKGDVSLWLEHLNKVLPDPNDQKIYTDYLAHCVKYPGYKIPWSPMLQSAEGIGKSVFFEVMQYALGDMYVYSPKAPELVKSGSTFNAWQRGKLLIVVNEIKIDERRELIEILKPMITDNRVEIQSKGVDQEMEDNPANWLFFSNYKDAVPITRNGRRYAIFYSVLQSKADILNAGMDEVYFKQLFDWLRNGDGLSAITHWLKTRPIEYGMIPVRAPETSSHAEALRISRSPMEVVVADCIQDGVCGFRGGYISSLAVLNKARTAGIRSPNTRTVQICLENMGFVHIGRADKAFMQEDVSLRAELYGTLSSLTVNGYGLAQGYE